MSSCTEKRASDETIIHAIAVVFKDAGPKRGVEMK